MKVWLKRYGGRIKRRNIVSDEDEETKLNKLDDREKLKRELLILSIKNLTYLNPNLKFSLEEINHKDSII